MQLSCAIITLQIFWAKPGRAYSEGGRVDRSNEWGGRRREGEARAKPGNQLVTIDRAEGKKLIYRHLKQSHTVKLLWKNLFI